MYQHLRPYQSSKIVIKGIITIGRKRNREIVRDERFLKKEIKKNKIKKKRTTRTDIILWFYLIRWPKRCITFQMQNLFAIRNRIFEWFLFILFLRFLKDSFTCSKTLLRKLLSIIRNVRKFHSCPTNNDNHWPRSTEDRPICTINRSFILREIDQSNLRSVRD